MSAKVAAARTAFAASDIDGTRRLPAAYLVKSVDRTGSL